METGQSLPGEGRERSLERNTREPSRSPSSPRRTGRSSADSLRSTTEAARRFQQTQLEAMVAQHGQLMQQQQAALQQIMAKLNEVSSGQQQRDTEIMTLRRQLDEVRGGILQPPGLSVPTSSSQTNVQQDPFQHVGPSQNVTSSGQGGSLPDPFQLPQGDPWAVPNAPARDAYESDSNPFRRSEKWMPAMPIAEHSKWKKRVDEVYDFMSYVHELSTWVGFGSDEFGKEILFAVRQPDEILQSILSKNQCTRSIRLMSILKAAFQNHARASLIMSNYEEKRFRLDTCGFEALRLLAREFCVKTRTELLFFREAFTKNQFKGDSIPETVRMIQNKLFEYFRIMEMVDKSVNVANLAITEADQCLVLLRSLPTHCRQWLVLNVVHEDFQSYVDAALRYESQLRAWNELEGKPIAAFGDNDKGKGDGKGKGKNKTDGKETRTCFECNQRGHLAVDCPNKRKWPKKGAEKGKGKSKGKDGKGKQKGGKDQKGDGKGKGKKGKGKGKRATETISESGEQPEEYPDEWSEIGEAEDGGRLSMLVTPKLPVKRSKYWFSHVKFFLLFVVQFLAVIGMFQWVSVCKLQAKPFLSQIQTVGMEPSFWLVDTGASRTVMSDDAVKMYRVIRERKLEDPLIFYTASAEEVRIDREVVIEAFFKVCDFNGRSKTQRFELRAAVGPVQHNLIGVSKMVRTGAALEYNHDGCKIFVSESSHIDCHIWCGVPWIEAKIPKSRKKSYEDFISSDKSHDDMQLDSSVFSDTSPCSPGSERRASNKGSVSQGSTPSSRSSMKTSVLRFNDVVDFADDKSFLKPTVDFGHGADVDFVSQHDIPQDEPEMPAPENEDPEVAIPADEPTDIPLPDPQSPDYPFEHDNKVEEKHDYRKLRKKDHIELQFHRMRGHFPFDARCEECRLSKGVTQHRRVVASKNEPVIQADIFYVGQHRFIVLAEAVSGLIGVSLLHVSSDKTTSNIRAFFSELGFSHVTSSSIAIEVKTDAELVVGQIVSRAQQGVKIIRAAPQAHASIGLAERSVRKLKEGAACVRCDLRVHGFDIRSDQPLAWEALFDYLAQCNNYFNVSGDEVANRRSPIQVIAQRDSTMPLCAVFGSVVHAKVPESLMSEVVEGSRFVPAAYKCLSHGQMSHDVVSNINGRVVHFKAEIKVLNRTVWNPEFWPDVLQSVEPSIPTVPIDIPHIDVDSSKEGHRVKGPSVSWVRQHGPTPGCQACVKSHARQHTSSCRKRYQDFLEAERRKMRDEVTTSHDRAVSRPIENIDSHPTGGVRFTGKRSPREIERLWDDDDVQDAPMPDVTDLQVEPSEVANGDAMSVEQLDENDMQIGFFNGCSALTDSPSNCVDVDTRRHGVFFPMYCPKKGETVQTEKFRLCGKDVHLVEPIGAVSECGMEAFTVEQAKEGRKVELAAMDKLSIGEVLDSATAQSRAKELGIKVIPCRCVLTAKQSDGRDICRARCVAQQVAAHESKAATLGISSNTPSCEAFRCVLAAAAAENLFLGTLDVSTAFLHSKLPKGIRAIIRLPADISFSAHDYDGVHMDLYSAVNGLRCASKAWLQLASSILQSLQLYPCPSDPCLFAGKLDGEVGTIALLYVDDILVASQSAEGVHLIKAALDSKVKTKLTGLISNDSGEGGSLTFLGRSIRRNKQERFLTMRVPPEYLESVYREFDVKPSETPPNIASDLEKKNGAPLTDEAANRYRRILGRIAWWAQTRVDHSRFISMLSVGQAIPTEFHEAAMRRYLRFLRSCCHLSQVFPSDYEYSISSIGQWGLVAVSDASWGSTETRHSVSGGSVFWLGSLVKAYSRVQKSITLSSCESEVIGICGLMQECLGLRHLTEFLSRYDSDGLSDFVQIQPHLPTDYEEVDPGVAIMCYTDSSSGIAVLKNGGLSRKVRHIALAVAYVQQLVQWGHVVVEWMSTTICVSDMLTKILSRELWNRHSQNMGFCEMDNPEKFQLDVSSRKSKKRNEPNTQEHIADGQTNSVQAAITSEPEEMFRAMKDLVNECINNTTVTHVIVDCCTSGRAGFSQIGFKFPGLRVVSITKLTPVEQCGFLPKMLKKLVLLKPVLGWFSPPCAGGSKVLNLCPEPRRSEIKDDHREKFLILLPFGVEIISRCTVRVVEMSSHCTFWTLQEVKDLIQDQALDHQHDVPRCMYDGGPKLAVAQHSFRLRSSDVEMFKFLRNCSCPDQSGLNKQTLDYPFHLAFRLARNFISR